MEFGLDLVISIPMELSLALNNNGSFTKNNEIYAYGVMGEDEVLSVSIDETYEDYLKIIYRKTLKVASSISSDTNFNGTVTESLSRASSLFGSRAIFYKGFRLVSGYSN